MNIIRQDDGTQGVFIAKDEQALAGEMTYTWQDDKVFVITLTKVADTHQGQGVGRALLSEAVAFARQNALKIVPKCPYAKSVFEKDQSIQDVLFEPT